METSPSHCELCFSDGGTPLWSNALCRVVGVDDGDFPGFCRVVLNRHAAEMSDLADDEQAALMRVVFAVENVVRELTQAHKINLASLGNVVPHVHWHVIPRWRNDRCFPNPIWAPTRRHDTHLPHAPAWDIFSARLRARLGEPHAGHLGAGGVS